MQLIKQKLKDAENSAEEGDLQVGQVTRQWCLCRKFFLPDFCEARLLK